MKALGHTTSRQRVLNFEYETSPIGSCIQHLVPRWSCCFENVGTVRSWSIAEEVNHYEFLQARHIFYCPPTSWWERQFHQLPHVLVLDALPSHYTDNTSLNHKPNQTPLSLSGFCQIFLSQLQRKWWTHRVAQEHLNPQWGVRKSIVRTESWVSMIREHSMRTTVGMSGQ